jgi:putative tryptophan/tyrosine transport system substrate-binding protein
MRKIVTFVALGAMLVGLSFVAYAQQPKKVPRIGRLGASSFSADSARIESFRQGLRDLGYVEGKNIIIEYRFAEGKLDRLPVLMAELVRLNVDVIVSGGATTTRLAREATATIPIVMSQDPDPVGSGFVASLARPGGNITGLSSLTADLSGKRLELLKEILPKFSRVAVFETSTNTGNAQQLRETELAAGELGIKLQHLDILGPKDIETAFRAAIKGRADAVLVLRGPVLASHRTQVIELAVKSRLPATYPQSDYMEDGGL